MQKESVTIGNISYERVYSPGQNRPKVTFKNYELSQTHQTISFKSCLRIVFILTFISILGTHNYISQKHLHLKAYKTPFTTHEKSKSFFHRRDEQPVSASTRQSKPLIPININNGTALVTACRNAHSNIEPLLSSWLGLPLLSQIIIVDWSSKPPLRFAVEELSKKNSLGGSHPHVTVLRVRNQNQPRSSASMARAFNIAFRYASAPYILSLPCGVGIQNTFFKKHKLGPDYFYSDANHLERSLEEQTFQPVLLIPRNVLQSVGGYDERIVSHSIVREDHTDLVRRLLQRGLARKSVDYDTLWSLGQNSGEVFSPQFVTVKSSRYESDMQRIEAAVNIRALSNLPAWNASSSELAFMKAVDRRIIVPSFRHLRMHYVSINLDSELESVHQLIPEDQLAMKKKSAISDYLDKIYGLPECLTRILPLPQRQGLLKSFADQTVHESSKPRALIVLAFGDLSERLQLLASAKFFAKQTGRILFVVWPRFLDIPDRFTSFFSLFHGTPEDLSIIENVDEVMLAEKACPRFKVLNNNTWMFSFNDSIETLDAIESIPENVENIRHVVVQGNTFIKSDVPQLSNPKSVRSELLDILKMPLHEEVATRLRDVNSEELSRAIGIYVPQSILSDSPDNNHSTRLQVFSAIHKKLSSSSSFSNNFNSSKTVYLNADRRIVERFKHLGLKLLPTLRASNECQMHGTKKCFIAELLQLKALTKTAKFYSPISDRFVRLIQTCREDGDDF